MAVEAIPLEIVHGFVPKLPLDHTLDSIQLPAVQDFITNRRLVHTQVIQSLEASRSRMQGVANPKRRDVTFQVGDQAWLSTSHLPLRLGSRKLAVKWTGPFRIVKIVAPQAYQLLLPKQWKIHDVFHTSQLKGVEGEVVVPDPVLLDSQEAEFEVDCILADRVVRGVQQYLVSWKGYDSFENSWEPVSNLSNCQQLLKQYLKQKSAQRGR